MAPVSPLMADHREVLFNDAHENMHRHHGAVTNVTWTTKYNLLTFFPKALFEQYRRAANAFFTAEACLTFTPVSPFTPVSLWVPLGFVLGLSLTKEAIEDIQRWQSDKKVNCQMVEVYNPAANAFEAREWRKVRVGEIVRMVADHPVPADLLLLNTSNSDGTAYVDTMELDGETSLKVKRALEETVVASQKGSADVFTGYRLDCEAPNNQLYRFAGNLHLPSGHVLPVSPAQMVLRGSTLRNTEWAMGVVVFAGFDTKIFMNATSTPSKRSEVEKGLDVIVLGMFVLLMVLACLTAGVTSVWTRDLGPSMWYLQPEDSPTWFDPKTPALVGVFSFVSCFILYSYLIPISLYVTIEIVKIMQAFIFMVKDHGMYHRPTDMPAIVRTSNLNEQLGQVHTILSDKTGTLTANQMDFFKCSIAGVLYGEGSTEIERMIAQKREPGKPSGLAEPVAQEKGFNFHDKRLEDGAWAQQPRREVLAQFFRALAVCNTTIPTHTEDLATIQYQAESPDESAFVIAAKRFGFVLCRRINKIADVMEPPEGGSGPPVRVQYEVLNVLEFSSTRKRMSVICRRAGSSEIILFCKGADTVIYPRLRPGSDFQEETHAHMGQLGDSGLRTLAVAMTIIPPATYEPWAAEYAAADMLLEGREEKRAALAEAMEKDLMLLGATGIEDKLQEGVPTTIEMLQAAGVGLWVLTGDKRETAINVGYACSLLSGAMRQHVVEGGVSEHAVNMPGNTQGGSRSGTLTQSNLLCGSCVSMPVSAFDGGKSRASGALPPAGTDSAHLSVQQKHMLEHGVVRAQLETALAAVKAVPGGLPAEPELNALIIDGHALDYALTDDLKYLFHEVSSRCKTVICCRVSPLQKALVTLLVRTLGKKITLAIGDGANDVGMIQAAHIGVGISGEEGRQAVMASDFAIAQFRFLQRLLLVHGRNNYRRLARMITFFYYKNLMLGLSLFWYQSWNFFSSQVIYDQLMLGLFNVIYASFHVIFFGWADQDMRPRTALDFPQLYRAGIQNRSYDLIHKAVFFTHGIYGSLVAFYLTSLAYAFDVVPVKTNGLQSGKDMVGITMYHIIVSAISGNLILNMVTINWVQVLGLSFTVAMWWLGTLVYGELTPATSGQSYKLYLQNVLNERSYWLIVLCICVILILPDLIIRSIRRNFFPADHHIICELEVDLKAAHRAEALLGRKLACTLGDPRSKWTAESPRSFPVDEATGLPTDAVGGRTEADEGAYPRPASRPTQAM